MATAGVADAKNKKAADRLPTPWEIIGGLVAATGYERVTV
jgi:hypothetical protein